MGQKSKALDTLEQLIDAQSADGSFPQAKTSITRSSGKGLAIEATSLALLCMLRVDDSRWASQIKKAVDYLMGQMNGGYFGSTQATILAMKALVEFMKVSSASSDRLQFEVSVGAGQYLMTVGDQMKFPDEGGQSAELTRRPQRADGPRP